MCADHRHATCANLATPKGLLEYARNGFVPIAANGKSFTMQAGRKDAGQVTMKDNYLLAKPPLLTPSSRPSWPTQQATAMTRIGRARG